MNARWAGMMLVAIVAWNAAFAAQARFGILLSIGVAATLCTARAFAVPAGWRELFAPRRDAFLIGAIAAGVAILLTAVLRGPVLRAFPPLEVQTYALYELFPSPSIVQGYVIVPLIAIAEELVFRGAIQFGFSQRLGPYGAAIAAALVYALAHSASALPLLIGLALVMGAFWGMLRAVTKSLWPSIICHVLWDLFVLVWAPLATPASVPLHF